MGSGTDAVQPILLWGAPQPPNQRIELQAGVLSCVFEPAAGFLRYVRCGPHELLRGVYAAVRGAGWITVVPRISGLALQRTHGDTTLSFHAVCAAPPVWFEWDGVIHASRAGSITFSFDGIARASFLRNRIGFCILHPDSCAGLPCTVEHVDGTVSHGAFPLVISPHQPFFNIRAIRHSINGIETCVTCDGDVFEMEDQRNWTDASFKTYCTPQELPKPVELAAGSRIRQTVTITARVARGAASRARSMPARVRCELLEQTVPAPVIGLGLPWGGVALDDRLSERVRALAPQHFRCELHLGHAHWRDDFHHAQQISQHCAVPLELALVLPAEPRAPLAEFAGACARAAPRIARCFVLSEGRAALSQREFSRATQALRACIPAHLIGTGTNRYFTELNRARPPLDGAACIAYSCNPQVHTFDNASMAETFSGQAWTVRSARAFCAGLPLHVSPLSLKPRPDPATLHDTHCPPRWADQRQASLFGLGFALGSIAQLAQAGAAGITCFDLCGWNGLMDNDQHGWLQHLCGRPGVYPVYHLLADIAEWAGYAWHAMAVSDPLRVAACAFVRGAHTVMLISNLTARPLSIVIPGTSSNVRMRVLDETSLQRALFDPETFRAFSQSKKTTGRDSLALRLRANAYVRLDLQ